MKKFVIFLCVFPSPNLELTIYDKWCKIFPQAKNLPHVVFSIHKEKFNSLSLYVIFLIFFYYLQTEASNIIDL